MARTFHIGGVRLKDCKLSAHSAMERVELPMRVVLPLGQHIGAPARPVVAAGDRVVRGQCVAEAASVVSASLHSPISGIVRSIGLVRNARGFDVEAIEIEATESDHRIDIESMSKPLVAVRDKGNVSADEILACVREAGIVGLGGATFPTAVKLNVPPGKNIDTLVINAAECEPYLTCDHALMLSDPAGIIIGAELVMKALGVSNAVIGVEDNKPDAIESLRSHVAPGSGIVIVPLKEKYPQGGEKQLIFAMTRREVPSGGLPADVGVVVVNVATARAVCMAVVYGEPLIERVVTVTGPRLPRPANYLVPIGYPVDELISKSGGDDVPVGKIVLGGPMMGAAVENTEVPVEKGSSGILLLPPDMSHRAQPEPCILCARCVSVCPMGLEPYLISTLSRLGRVGEAVDAGVADCIECGSCSYICPSSRPILDFIRYGKMSSRRVRKSK